MHTSILDYVLSEFEKTGETYKQIAQGAGVPRSTVEKIARRETPNPGVIAVEKLASYFRTRKLCEADRAPADEATA